MEIIKDINKFDIKNVIIDKTSKTSNRYNVLYNSKKFYIDPLNMFKSLGIKDNYYNSNSKTYKIPIIVDKEIQDHHFLISIINHIHDKIEIFEKKVNIIHPLISKNNVKTCILNLVLYSNTILKNYENHEQLDIESLLVSKTSFYIYPILCSPKIVIYNDKIYTTYSIHEAYLKVFNYKEQNKKESIINYENVINAVNKIDN